MTNKGTRKKTNYKSIYYNEGTKKYDVKYNYKEYDPILQKNKYKSQWVYNCLSLNEAKEALAKLQIGITKTEDKDITLASAFELWKNKAITQQFSEMTINSTLVGNPASDMALPRDVYWRILRNQLTVMGTWNSSFLHEPEDDWNYVLGRLAKKRITPADMITHRFALEELEQGFHMIRDKTEDYVKVMVAV